MLVFMEKKCALYTGKYGIPYPNNMLNHLLMLKKGLPLKDLDVLYPIDQASLLPLRCTPGEVGPRASHAFLSLKVNETGYHSIKAA